MKRFDLLDPIGGFFELETPTKMGDRFYHDKAMALSTGRACITHIVEKKRPSLVYIPTYACAAVREPFLEKHITTVLYEVDQSLEPTELPTLKSGEYFFYINYFGLKRSFIEQLRENYGNRLLIDNTHDFFARDSRVYYSFNSARKFFGVSDGAFLYGPKCEADIKQLTRFNKSDNTPNILRLNKDYENAFTAYQKYEESLGCEVNRISNNAERILKGIDYVKIRKTRRANFKFLHAQLKEKNIFKFERLGRQDPFCYPFLPINNINVTAFHEDKLFIPRFWKDIIDRKLKVSKFERSLCEDLLPIPIDHRYSEVQLGRIVRLVNKLS